MRLTGWLRNLSFRSKCSAHITTPAQNGSATDSISHPGKRKYYRLLPGLLLLLTLMLVLSLVALIIVSVNLNKTGNSCQSRECLRTAATLLYSMDEETDPCEDFYQFTCGHWADQHPRPDAAAQNDWYRERAREVMRTVRQFLQANITDEEPEAVRKAKVMYKACMNTELLDKRELAPAIHYLREFQLPVLPSGLNITLTGESATKYGEAAEFNWLHSLVLIKKILGMDLIIGFDTFPDPFNRTVNRIGLGVPQEDSPLHFTITKHRLKTRRYATASKQEGDEEVDEDPTYDKDYVTYVKKMLKIYLLYLDPSIKIEEAEHNAEEMAIKVAKMDAELDKLMEIAQNHSKTLINSFAEIVSLSVDDLQNRTDELIAPKTLPLWVEYLELMMQGVNLTEEFDVDTLQVITSQADILYLQSLVEYLVQVPPEHIEFFIWLSVMEELVLHTTSEMRLLQLEYTESLKGVEGSTSRSQHCTDYVHFLMSTAVSYVLADDSFTRHKLPKVERMLSDIRHSFDDLIRATSWLDTPTKRKILLKSVEIKSFIGFPEWITNATALDEAYDGMQANESTHMENIIGVLSWQMQTQLESLNDMEENDWSVAPSIVNSFYRDQFNSITIPVAILQYPFYDLGLEALNYGSIGSTIGHELTHGFDDSGRMFDRSGNVVEWWSNASISEYVNRTECFVDQYSRYFLEDIGEYIDGKLTLGENIADNIGMRASFYAYRDYIKSNAKEEMKLPGLEQYTAEQLFFIAFGNSWCEINTQGSLREALQDTHCPGEVRLKGVISNSEEFAEIFKCRKGSAMNPDEPKCMIW